MIAAALTSITWEREGFALADGYDEASQRYRGLVLPGGDAHFGAVTDTTLLVSPAAAVRQIAAEIDVEPEPGPGRPLPGGLDLGGDPLSRLVRSTAGTSACTRWIPNATGVTSPG